MRPVGGTYGRRPNGSSLFRVGGVGLSPAGTKRKIAEWIGRPETAVGFAGRFLKSLAIRRRRRSHLSR